MSNEQYAAIIDEFSNAVAGLLPHAPPEVIERLGRATGNLLETVANRGAMLAAQAVMPLAAEVERLKRSERARNDRVNELQRTVNGQIDSVYVHMPPDLTEAVTQLALDVEQLKDRAVNDDASNEAGPRQS